jgi:hypothetical protein
VQARLVVLIGIAVALAVGTAWLLELSLERVLILAPALVLGTGLVIAVLMLLARALVESIRELERPRLVLGLIAAGIALIAVLTVLGVELPRE